MRRTFFNDLQVLSHHLALRQLVRPDRVHVHAARTGRRRQLAAAPPHQTPLASGHSLWLTYWRAWQPSAVRPLSFAEEYGHRAGTGRRKSLLGHLGRPLRGASSRHRKKGIHLPKLDVSGSNPLTRSKTACGALQPRRPFFVGWCLKIGRKPCHVTFSFGKTVTFSFGCFTSRQPHSTSASTSSSPRRKRSAARPAPSRPIASR